jgi:hypothetical protein
MTFQDDGTCRWTVDGQKAGGDGGPPSHPVRSVTTYTSFCQRGANFGDFFLDRKPGHATPGGFDRTDLIQAQLVKPRGRTTIRSPTVFA